MENLSNIIQKLSEAYVILQDIEVRGRYAEELVFSQQKVEQAINEIRLVGVDDKIE